MIARTWRGAVRREDADAYADYMDTTGVDAYASTPGNRGVGPALVTAIGLIPKPVMKTFSKADTPAAPPESRQGGRSRRHPW